MVAKMKLSGLWLVCGVVFSFAGSASLAAVPEKPPTPRQLELAHRYIELIHIDKTYGDAMRALGPSILASMPKEAGSDPVLQQKVLDAVNEAASDLMITIVKRMEPIMAEIYTEEELSDLVAFYQSKSGRALLDKQPLMVAKMGPLMQEVMPQFQASLKNKVCARVDCKALEAKK